MLILVGLAPQLVTAWRVAHEPSIAETASVQRFRASIVIVLGWFRGCTEGVDSDYGATDAYICAPLTYYAFLRTLGLLRGKFRSGCSVVEVGTWRMLRFGVHYILMAGFLVQGGQNFDERES